MKIINHEENGLQVSQRIDDGYMNLTQMAKNNGKKINDYLRLDTTKAFLSKLSTVTGIPATGKNGLIQIRQGGNNKNAQGTWGHPKVAINCAMWCDAEFAVFVTNLVFDWMSTGQNPIQPQPTSTEIPADLAAVVEELENLIVSIRSHGRIIHLGSHQPVDQILFKSLHTLSHNQLSVINATIQQLELLKKMAEMNTADGSPDPAQTINFLLGNPTPTKPEPTATEARTVETSAEKVQPSPTAADDTEGDENKAQQLTTINIKIPSSQRQWLSDTARQVRRNNTKPVPPAERVYPQHLVSIAIQLLQNSNLDLEAAHSIRLEQDEATASLNIKISRQQKEWLTDTAKSIRDSNQQPTCPNEHIYPQHLIAIALGQLQQAKVRWHKVGNVKAIEQRLATPCHLHLV